MKMRRYNIRLLHIVTAVCVVPKNKHQSKGQHPGLHCAKVLGFAKDKLGSEGDALDSFPKWGIWANHCYVEPMTLCQEDIARELHIARDITVWGPNGFFHWSRAGIDRAKSTRCHRAFKREINIQQDSGIVSTVFFQHVSNIIYWDHDPSRVLANRTPCLKPVMKRFCFPICHSHIPGNKWLPLYIWWNVLVLKGNRYTMIQCYKYFLNKEMVALAIPNKMWKERT